MRRSFKWSIWRSRTSPRNGPCRSTTGSLLSIALPLNLLAGSLNEKKYLHKTLDRLDKARFISEEKFEELNCTEVFPGDILISRLPDPVGRACRVPFINSRMITSV